MVKIPVFTPSGDLRYDGDRHYEGEPQPERPEHPDDLLEHQQSVRLVVPLLDRSRSRINPPAVLHDPLEGLVAGGNEIHGRHTVGLREADGRASRIRLRFPTDPIRIG